MAFSQRDSEFTLDFGGAIPPQLRSRLKWGVVIVGLILLFVLLSLLRSVYTELLWFGELGFRAVYVKILLTRVVLFIIGASIFAVPAGVSLYLANRLSQGPEEIPLPQATRDVLKKLITWGAVGAVVVLSVIFGILAAAQWEVSLRFGSRLSFADTDPVFLKDISFYVFSLPLYEFVRGWLLGAAGVILVATLAMYFVNFSFRGVGLLITPGLKVHVSIIAAMIMVFLGVGHWLSRWDLVLSDQGAAFGAMYTDLHARKLALLLLTIFAFVAALLIFVNAYMRGIRLLVGGVALWVVMSLLLGVVWPNAMQRFTVNPNEFAREQPYIDRNIEFTRKGFGLDNITEELYPVDPSLTAELVSENLQTVGNIRLWDHGPLSSVYRQLQLIRPYYDFKDADVDRYQVGGEYRQVMLAAREIAQEKLDPDAQTWVNTRLRYTHGFGVAMSPVTEFTPEGRPEFFAQDIPSDGVISVQPKSPIDAPETVIDNPRIYYGEKTTDYVIVNTNTDELDYQVEGGELKSIRYNGAGGVPVSSFIRRAAYAWQFADVNIFITGEITGESKIQYRRAIQERISAVTPFLRLDEDPYIVAAEGGLFWIQDMYTVSDRFPYSDPFGENGDFNYIRNSVKATVDAFNGTVVFYVVDPTDPLIQTYSKIFPDLFVPIELMPPSLLSHLRYPRDLFGFQADKYIRYHMLDSQDFYNLEDIWSIPEEKVGQSGTLQEMEPYYVIMKLPGETSVEFVLLLPYTRNEPPIMAGWLAARNDGANYGKLVAFNFPKDRQVDSPEQIEAKIDNDPDISEWFTLRCQEGSFCIRGNLLVIPMTDAAGETFSILYAEPVYLQAEGVEFPELKQVILATGEKVVMRGSVLEALEALTGFTEAAAAAPTDGTPAPPSDATEPPSLFRAEIDRVTELLDEIKSGMASLEEALQGLKDLAGDR